MDNLTDTLKSAVARVEKTKGELAQAEAAITQAAAAHNAAVTEVTAAYNALKAYVKEFVPSVGSAPRTS